MRFAIRDILLLIAIIGLALCWWIDHCKLALANSKLHSDNLGLALRVAAAESFPNGDLRIREIYEAAQLSPPSPEVAAEIITTVRHSQDFRIRIRAMAVLPLLNEREAAINVLLDALRERVGERCGEGNVPAYAASYLAQMNATNSAGEIKAWIYFLKQKSPYDPSLTLIFLESAEKHLKRLEERTESESDAEGDESPALATQS